MDWIKKTFVINLDRREDRFQEFVDRVNKNGIMFPRMERFPAIDGEKLFDRYPMTLEPDLLKFVKTMVTEQLWTSDWGLTEGKEGLWSAGEMGCLFSHYSILSKIVNDDTLIETDVCLVMEDDLFMNDDFNEEMTRIGNVLSEASFVKDHEIELLWIAGRSDPHFEAKDKDMPGIYERITDRLFLRKAMNLKNTHDWYRQTTGYLLSKTGAQKMMDSLESRYFVKPVDHAMLDSHVKQFDWFPHLGYSPLDYKTDVQGGRRDITPYNVLRLVLYNQYNHVFRKIQSSITS